MDNEKPPTHTAYAMKRENRHEVRWLEIGVARVAGDATATHDVFIDRLPTGGFNGHIRLSPIGVIPGQLEFEPVRPTRLSGDDQS